MLAFLPLLALASSVYAFRLRASGWRTPFVLGAVAWGTALVVITEGLSPFERVDRVELSIAWLAFIGIAAYLGRRGRALSTLEVERFTFDPLNRSQLAAVGVLLIIALSLALLAAPTVPDSMTYHLPRVEHWIQNKSVASYRTNIERELWPGPGAEYILLHLEILSRTDRGVTLTLWAAYAANIVVASLIAKQLHASQRGQVFAAFLAATLPGAVAQATGSQVELVFAFWLACAVSLGLRLIDAERGARRLPASIAFGAAAGLAIFAKATTYLYFAPFAIWFLIASLRRDGLSVAVRLMAVAAFVAVAINAPHYHRNIVLYGNALSKPGANGVVNSAFFPGGTVSNIVRNLSLHFGTPSESVNAAAESVVHAIDRTLGVAPDDQRTTFPGERYRFIGRQSAEQTAGSPIQVVAALVTFGFLISAGRKRHRTQMAYMLCVAGGFLLFSFYLRWQPWHARLHVPLLMLSAPVVAFAAERIQKRAILWMVSGLAFVSALPPLLRNPVRPLVGAAAVYTIPRERQYFAEHPGLYPIYKAATDRLKSIGCRDLGLWVQGDAAEYPLWTMLRTNRRDGVRIRHVSIQNQSAGLRSTPSGDNFSPCALMYINSEGRYKPVVIPVGYDLTWQQGNIRIYTPSSRSPVS